MLVHLIVLSYAVHDDLRVIRLISPLLQQPLLYGPSLFPHHLVPPLHRSPPDFLGDVPCSGHHAGWPKHDQLVSV